MELPGQGKWILFFFKGNVEAKLSAVREVKEVWNHHCRQNIMRLEKGRIVSRKWYRKRRGSWVWMSSGTCLVSHGFPPADTQGPREDQQEVDSSIHTGLAILLDSNDKQINRKEVQIVNGAWNRRWIRSEKDKANILWENKPTRWWLRWHPRRVIGDIAEFRGEELKAVIRANAWISHFQAREVLDGGKIHRVTVEAGH